MTRQITKQTGEKYKKKAHLCILRADVDRGDIVNDVFNAPPIDSLAIAAGHVSAE